MKPADNPKLRSIFESAHGQQQYSPLSNLLSKGIDYDRIKDCLHYSSVHRGDHEDWLAEIRRWLIDKVDPEVIEDQEQIPHDYLRGLRALGCLSARIPIAYAGGGLDQSSYSRMLETVASHSEVLALVVSVQQLGVAQGLLSAQKLYPECANTLQLSETYLQRLADNQLGAFCLTTPETGSDPSRLQTIARAIPDGDGFELEGDWHCGGKLYTTLGSVADIYMMLAVVVYPGEKIESLETGQRITAFLVERETSGIEIRPLSFCGWRGLPNAAIRLNRVRIPAVNRVGKVGDGLKIAFMNLASGRINISAIAVGMMKQLTRSARWWSVERVQGGKSIGEHQLNREQLIDIHCYCYAAESFLRYVSSLSDQGKADIRLEAAMLKLFCSHSLFKIADQTLQLRGGRGYETYASQHRRGDIALPVERLFRSARMLQIGEGGSNILRLYIMRCLFNSALNQKKELQNTKSPRLFFSLVSEYCRAYLLPRRTKSEGMPVCLENPMQFVSGATRRLFRQCVYEFLKEGLCYCLLAAKTRLRGQNIPLTTPIQNLENRQQFLADCSEIALELAAMTVCCLRAAASLTNNEIELAAEYCIRSRERIEILFVQIRQRSVDREDHITQMSDKIMRADYAETFEDNLVPWDLPGIES